MAVWDAPVKHVTILQRTRSLPYVSHILAWFTDGR
jgi:hypothetical protein